MRHHTKDPGERASDIASADAQRVWRETGDYDTWFKTYQETRDSALMEFQPIEGREV